MIHVRPARPEDVPRLIEIASHSSASGASAARWHESEYAKLCASQPGSPDWAGFAEAAVEKPGGWVALVIQENSQVAGFLVGRRLTPDGAEWEIENVAVSGAAQRRGLGSRLLGEFLALARERGAREIFLEVRASNVAARRLYEKWGFVEAGVRKSYYQGPTEDALVLRLSFPSGTAKIS